MIEERTQDILEAVVREFIETGEPVSSGWLFDKYDFGIKPAMIRFEMNDLTERGFLEQPYHSAGRVPTNRGYEFFAEQALEDGSAANRIDRELQSLFNNEAWPELLSRISETLGLLGAAVDMATGEVYKSGLENLIDNIEWHDRAELKTIIRDFEELDERITGSNQFSGDTNFIKVFVGKKSPITRSEGLSVIAGDYNAGGTRILLCAIGPTRMDYEKAADVFKELKHKNHGKRHSKE